MSSAASLVALRDHIRRIERALRCATGRCRSASQRSTTPCRGAVSPWARCTKSSGPAPTRRTPPPRPGSPPRLWRGFLLLKPGSFCGASSTAIFMGRGSQCTGSTRRGSCSSARRATTTSCGLRGRPAGSRHRRGGRRGGPAADGGRPSAAARRRALRHSRAAAAPLAHGRRGRRRARPAKRRDDALAGRLAAVIAGSRRAQPLGIGRPRWRIELLRCRGAEPAEWICPWI